MFIIFSKTLDSRSYEYYAYDDQSSNGFLARSHPKIYMRFISQPHLVT